MYLIGAATMGVFGFVYFWLLNSLIPAGEAADEMKSAGPRARGTSVEIALPRTPTSPSKRARGPGTAKRGRCEPGLIFLDQLAAGRAATLGAAAVARRPSASSISPIDRRLVSKPMNQKAKAPSRYQKAK